MKQLPENCDILSEGLPLTAFPRGFACLAKCKIPCACNGDRFPTSLVSLVIESLLTQSFSSSVSEGCFSSFISGIILSSAVFSANSVLLNFGAGEWSINALCVCTGGLLITSLVLITI